MLGSPRFHILVTGFRHPGRNDELFFMASAQNENCWRLTRPTVYGLANRLNQALAQSTGYRPSGLDFGIHAEMTASYKINGPAKDRLIYF